MGTIPIRLASSLTESNLTLLGALQIHHIHLHSPTIILVPDTFVATDTNAARKPSALIQNLYEEFEDVPFEQVSRKYWNDTAGIDFVTQLAVQDDERAGTLLSLTDKWGVSLLR